MPISSTSPIIVTGSPHTEDLALEWLKAYGAQIIELFNLTVIIIPDSVKFDSGHHTNTRSLSFKDQFDDDETCVEVYVSANARETELAFKPDDKYKGILEHVSSYFIVEHDPSHFILSEKKCTIKYTKLEYNDSEEVWDVTFDLLVHSVAKIQNLHIQFTFDDNGSFIIVKPLMELPSSFRQESGKPTCQN